MHTKKDLIFKLDAALKKNSSPTNRITINQYEINVNDENQIYKLFYKNHITDLCENITIEQIGQLSVISLQNKNREMSSWCVHYLLTKIKNVKLDFDTPIEQQVAIRNSPYTLLLCWHINQLFYLKDKRVRGRAIHIMHIL